MGMGLLLCRSLSVFDVALIVAIGVLKVMIEWPE